VGLLRGLPGNVVNHGRQVDYGQVIPGPVPVELRTKTPPRKTSKLCQDLSVMKDTYIDPVRITSRSTDDTLRYPAGRVERDVAPAPARAPVVGDPDVEAVVGEDVRQRLLRRGEQP
jgi:hypothetical protein